MSRHFYLLTKKEENEKGEKSHKESYTFGNK